MPSTLGLLLASVSWLSAQVSLELQLDQEQFLRNEALPVKVRIGNLSGQPLHLGGETNWLIFSVQSIDGSIVLKRAEVEVGGEFTVESATAATKWVDLAPAFNLGDAGRYRVTATAKLRSWGREITSKPKNFDIVNGARLWEQEFGVPTTNGAPEVRKYALQQATTLQQMRLCVRLTDATETRVFRVVPLGSVVSFAHPEARLDRESNLHVLFHSGARVFDYCVISPAGEITGRETYEFTNTRPTLRADEAGRPKVVGGARRARPSDPPASFSGTVNNDVKRSAP